MNVGTLINVLVNLEDSVVVAIGDEEKLPSTITIQLVNGEPNTVVVS